MECRPWSPQSLHLNPLEKLWVEVDIKIRKTFQKYEKKKTIEKLPLLVEETYPNEVYTPMRRKYKITYFLLIL